MRLQSCDKGVDEDGEASASRVGDCCSKDRLCSYVVRAGKTWQSTFIVRFSLNIHRKARLPLHHRYQPSGYEQYPVLVSVRTIDDITGLPGFVLYAAMSSSFFQKQLDAFKENASNASIKLSNKRTVAVQSATPTPRPSTPSGSNMSDPK